jgi:hypothetical protein
MAYSWNSVSVPGNGSVERRILVGFGSFSNANVVLGIAFPSLSGFVGHVCFVINVISTSAISDDLFSLFVVVDVHYVTRSAVNR